MNVRHRLAHLLVVLAVVGTGLAVPLDGALAQGTGVEFAIDKAITWDVNYDKREITVTVGMAFYNPNCDPGIFCEPSIADVTAVVDAIQLYWNGFNYACFKFKVVVIAQTVGSQSEVGPDEVDVALDSTPMSGIHSFVKAEGDASQYLSDDPGARVIPQHDPVGSTTWSANGRFPSIWAHEFGHVLGLHDNYDPKDNKKLLPGAAEDLMYASRFGSVSQEMVNRVVRRSGRVDDNRMHCDNTFEATLTVTQKDHIGMSQNVIITPPNPHCSGGISTSSGEQTFSVKSTPVRIDAVELKDPPDGWGDQTVVFVPHGEQFSQYSAPDGTVELAPILFTVRSSVKVNRQEHRPGLPPLPGDPYVLKLACADGGTGGHAPVSDCGAKRYDLEFDIRVPEPNRLFPYAPVPPDELYTDCISMDDAPGFFISYGNPVHFDGGAFPTFEVLDPGIKKIVVLGTATMDYRSKGGITTDQMSWTLTLCRVVNDKPAC